MKIVVFCLTLALQCFGQFNHIILVVQENRTPDNLFGSCTIPGADVLPIGNPVALGTTQDISHSHASFMSELAGNYPPLAQNYVQNSDVQPYCLLAQNYGFANRMFQTNQGPSGPAHQFLFGGTSAPVPVGQINDDWMAADNGGSCINSQLQDFIDSVGGMHTGSGCEDRGTLTDLMDGAGISWAYYTPSAGNLWTAPNMIQHICQPSGSLCSGREFKTHVIMPSATRSILTDILRGNLAQMSWVIPAGVNSDHAAYGSGGPAWVSSIVNAVGQSPYWNDTAILVTWDDWGGWYDHVPPPPNTTGWCVTYCFGFRVPLLAISSKTPVNYVSNQPMDFGSILKFVEQNFGLPLIANGTYADAYAQFDSGMFNGPIRRFQKVIARPLTHGELTSTSDPDND